MAGIFERLKVNLRKKVDESYFLTIGIDLFKDLAEYAIATGASKVAIVTDSNVKKLYGDKLLATVKEMNPACFMVSVNAGEESKSRKNKEKIEDLLVVHGFDRSGIIIALGGGVVGDLAGFVAATYMRGVPFIQAPTTLLAMCDSSIGGKTAINTEAGKNLIGAFNQPKAVFMDLNTLRTLEKQEILNGLAEIIKHAIIADKKLFYYLRQNMDKIISVDESSLQNILKRSCQIKISVVENDEKESGKRKSLNFGHTIGHAVEKASEYSIPHGMAVAFGMATEAKIASEMGLLDGEDAQSIHEILKVAGFDLKIKIDNEKIIELTKYDKKNREGKTLYVLPTSIGKVAYDISVDDETARKALGELC